MGCNESKKSKKVQPEFTCKISSTNLDDSSKGIFLGKMSYHPILLAENCIDGDKKNKQLQELRRTKGKITACGFLHDGSAVLVDEIRKLILLLQKDRGACNFLTLKSEPIGIAVFGIDIFITLADKKVEYVTVVNDKIVHKNTFKTGQPCLGIASFNGDIAVGFKNAEIQILDRKFQKHRSFFLPKFEDGRLISPTSMTQFKQTLLVTDYFAHVVIRVTLKGEPLFVYNGMTSPRCTVTDNTGNIILAGYDDMTGEKIQQLSPRGEKIPSRISTTDITQFPYCVAFYRKYSKLLIAGESDRCETCILQIMETSNQQAKPESNTLVDATTDTFSENMSLMELENTLGTLIENPLDKTVEKTASPTNHIIPVAAVGERAVGERSVASLDNASNNDADRTKTDTRDAEETPTPDVKTASYTDVQKAHTAFEATLPNEVPDNTAVTVYDKTNKGVVKKVLITVREKKPKTTEDSTPITVFEKTPEVTVEQTPLTVIDEQQQNHFQDPDSGPLPLVSA